MKEDVEVVCRFCLDGGQTPINPLLDPCECKGSIQFVHKQCLIRWRHMNIERNGEVCYVCHTEYKIPLDTDLELIPTHHLLYFTLDSPLLYNIINHYIWLVLRLFVEASPEYSFLGQYWVFQVCTHSLLLSLMIQRTRVKNWSRYAHRWSQDNRWMFFIFHMLILVARPFGSSALAWCVSNFAFQVYWKAHVDILEDINRGILHLN